MLTLTNKEVEGYLETVISKYLEYPEELVESENILHNLKLSWGPGEFEKKYLITKVRFCSLKVLIMSVTKISPKISPKYIAGVLTIRHPQQGSSNLAL